VRIQYRYLRNIVYNIFPWPEDSEKEKNRIESTAQEIIAARNSYSKNSLTDLYDELTIPLELQKAQQENNRFVMVMYGMEVRVTKESDAVEKLLEMYNDIT